MSGLRQYADATGSKPMTKKVRMPDGTIKVKVQGEDGSWKWQKSVTSRSSTPANNAIAGHTRAVALTGKSASIAPAEHLAMKAATFPQDIKLSSINKPSKKYQRSEVNRTVGQFFHTAKILDAVLPEHLRVGDDLANDLVGHSDIDSDNTSVDSDRDPSSASSKQLAGLAANGVKVKVKMAKNSVYRTDEVGSSDDEARCAASSHTDTINAMKQKTFIDEKTNIAYQEKEMQDPKKRPTRGRRLQRRTSRLAQGLAWAIAFFFPILFLVIAGLNASLDRKDASGTDLYHFDLANRMMQLNKIAVSMWPILFGAIVAQSLRMYAAWRVERGIKLIELEQFIGSHSLATSIKQPFFLQTINWTAVALICLWALSPIAGQSFVRMLSTDNQHETFMRNLSYVDFAHLNQNTGILADSLNGSHASAAPIVNIMFASALFTELPVAQADPWQYALVLYNDTAHASTLMRTSRIQDWASFAGLAVPNMDLAAHFDETGRIANSQSYFTTVTVPYSSYVFSCANARNTTINDINQATLYPTDPTTQAVYNLQSDSSNTTWMAAIPPATYLPGPSLNATDGSWNTPIVGSAYKSALDPGVLFFAVNYTDSTTHTGFSDEVIFWNCSYYNQYQDISLNCSTDQAACNVPRQQLLPNSTNIYLSNNFVRSFIGSLGIDPSPGYHVPELVQYMFNSAYFTSDPSEDISLLDFSIASDSGESEPFENTFSYKFAKLINTYHQISFTYPLYQSYEGGLYGTAWDQVKNLNYTSGPLIAAFAVYRIHWQWFGVLVFSCILLLTFGVVGIMLDHQTIGPDIIGFASSLTRDNRYIKLEDDDIELASSSTSGEGTSSKNAFETMKDLRHHEVMLQDVRGHQDIGKIALSSVGLTNSKPLSKDRLYR